MKQTAVKFSKQALKEVKKLPQDIRFSLMQWVTYLETIGVVETRKIKGYHDEPLKGERKGQRSVRLNKAYRAIYTETVKGKIEVMIVEVNKHKY